MKFFLLTISLFWILIGLTALLYPLKIKQFYSRILNLSKTLFFLPLIAGILFLWSTPASSLAPLIRILAVISFLKAILLLILPHDLLRAMFNRILSLPLVFYRVEGVFIVGLGIIVGWSAW